MLVFDSNLYKFLRGHSNFLLNAKGGKIWGFLIKRKEIYMAHMMICFIDLPDALPYCSSLLPKFGKAKKQIMEWRKRSWKIPVK